MLKQSAQRADSVTGADGSPHPRRISRASASALAMGIAAVAGVLGLTAIAGAQALPRYQGLLTTGAGERVNGPVDLRMALFATATGGTALQSVEMVGVSVVDGVFTTEMPFDSRLFNTTGARYVELSVRSASTGPGFVLLGTRQPVSPAPVAAGLQGVERTANQVRDQSSIGTPAGDPLTPVSLTTDPATAPWQTYSDGLFGTVVGIDVVLRNVATAPATVTATLHLGAGVAQGPFRTVTVSVPPMADAPVRIPVSYSGAPGQVTTLRLAGPSTVAWSLTSGDALTGARSSVSAGRDFLFTTWMDRGGRSTYTFAGNVAARAFNASRATISSGMTARGFTATNATVVNQLTAPGAVVGQISSPLTVVNSAVIPTLDALTGVLPDAVFSVNFGAGLTNPNNAVMLQVFRNVTATGWHWYLSNSTPVSASFRDTGMRLTSAGFFEVSSAVASGNFARLLGTGAWTSVSDARLKADVTDADVADLAATARALRPVRYRFKSLADDPAERLHLGFIAQDVERLLPDMVSDDGERLTLNYAGMSTVAIAAAKQLAVELRLLEEENEDLAAQNAVIASRLERIETARAATTRP